MIDVDNLEDLSRRELQAAAKEVGIRANKKSTDLMDALREHYASDIMDVDANESTSSTVSEDSIEQIEGVMLFEEAEATTNIPAPSPCTTPRRSSRSSLAGLIEIARSTPVLASPTCSSGVPSPMPISSLSPDVGSPATEQRRRSSVRLSLIRGVAEQLASPNVPPLKTTPQQAIFVFGSGGGDKKTSSSSINTSSPSGGRPLTPLNSPSVLSSKRSVRAASPMAKSSRAAAASPVALRRRAMERAAGGSALAKRSSGIARKVSMNGESATKKRSSAYKMPDFDKMHNQQFRKMSDIGSAKKKRKQSKQARLSIATDTTTATTSTTTVTATTTTSTPTKPTPSSVTRPSAMPSKLPRFPAKSGGVRGVKRPRSNGSSVVAAVAATADNSTDNAAESPLKKRRVSEAPKKATPPSSSASASSSSSSSVATSRSNTGGASKPVVLSKPFRPKASARVDTGRSRPAVPSSLRQAMKPKKTDTVNRSRAVIINKPFKPTAKATVNTRRPKATDTQTRVKPTIISKPFRPTAKATIDTRRPKAAAGTMSKSTKTGKENSVRARSTIPVV